MTIDNSKQSAINFSGLTGNLLSYSSQQDILTYYLKTYYLSPLTSYLLPLTYYLLLLTSHLLPITYYLGFTEKS